MKDTWVYKVQVRHLYDYKSIPELMNYLYNSVDQKTKLVFDTW
jgi:hypothetical protein